MDRQHAEVVAAPVRWLHLPGVSGPLNLGLVRDIFFGINPDTMIPSCRITMAYSDLSGWPVEHTVDDPAVMSGLRNLMAHESVWIHGGASSVDPPIAPGCGIY